MLNSSLDYLIVYLKTIFLSILHRLILVIFEILIFIAFFLIIQLLSGIFLATHYCRYRLLPTCEVINFMCAPVIFKNFMWYPSKFRGGVERLKSSTSKGFFVARLLLHGRFLDSIFDIKGDQARPLNINI